MTDVLSPVAAPASADAAAIDPKRFRQLLGCFPPA